LSSSSGSGVRGLPGVVAGCRLEMLEVFETVLGDFFLVAVVVPCQRLSNNVFYGRVGHVFLGFQQSFLAMLFDAIQLRAETGS